MLILDVWHPDLTTREIKVLGLLQEAYMRRAKLACDASGADEDNFFSIIDRAREIVPPSEKIWA